MRRPGQASLAAAAYVLCDLASQGWAVRTDGEVQVMPEASVADAAEEKQRVRRQELLKRDEQLIAALGARVRRGHGAAPGIPRGVRLDLQPHAGRPGPEGRAGAGTAPGSHDPSALRAAIDPTYRWSPPASDANTPGCC